MAPRAQLQAEAPDLVRDRARASDRVDLIRECGEGAVARVVDLVPVIPLEALPDDGVVPGEQNAPTTIPELRREPGRVDDVVNRTVARTCSRRRTIAGVGASSARRSNGSAARAWRERAGQKLDGPSRFRLQGPHTARDRRLSSALHDRCPIARSGD
jgi:hypothetical protein